MSAAINKLKKLRGRSFDELRQRGTQLLAAYAERGGLSARARVPADAEFCRLLEASALIGTSVTAESLLAHFRTRRTPHFFAGFADRAATVAEWRRRWPLAPQQAVERADRIGAGRFDLLGLRELDFGELVDWHLEPLSGKRAPQVHWSRIGELDPSATGDKKIVWELNRQQHLVTLGRAYWHTGDERYAQLFAAHLDGWIKQNPPALGVNWISNLEVAFRVISWLWALHYFKDSPHLTPPLFLRACKHLYLHGQHLETYLSTYSSPNTHLTGEALGLFYLGTLLPELPLARRWRDTGEQVLLQQLKRHVKPDGVYFEQTSYYHRYTTDFYAHLYLLSRANNLGLEAALEARLTALLDHLMYITRPDGTTPLFGDDDGGRLMPLGEAAPNDFRAALSTGAALFGRADYKFVCGGLAEETLWLLGPEGVRRFDGLDARPPAHASRAFIDGGYYVMRDGWTPDANYMLIDGGAHGEPTCGHAHAHADALSFELAARGRTMLVDPGTYSYTGSDEMRNYFRSSAAHSTLTIDEAPSSVPGGPFSWQQIAQVSTRAWVSCERFDYFAGQHDGYMRLASPAMHRRDVLFVKGGYWIVRDRVTSSGAHLYQLHFHFATDSVPETKTADGHEPGAASAVYERGADVPGLDLFAFDSAGQWHKSEGWVSNCYAARAAAPVYTFSMQAEGPQEFVTMLVPRRAGAAREEVARELRADGGRAFELLNESGRDILTMGGGNNGGEVVSVETETLVADCEWAVVRRRHDEALSEVLLLNAQQLDLNGSTIFKATQRIGYLAAQYANGQLSLLTDSDTAFSVATFGAERVSINGTAFATHGASMIEVAGQQLVGTLAGRSLTAA